MYDFRRSIFVRVFRGAVVQHLCDMAVVDYPPQFQV